MWQYSDGDTAASITEKVCFYSQHIDLPYCQMPEYIRDITYERYNNTLTNHNNNNHNNNNNINNTTTTTNSDHSITNTTNSHEVYLDGDKVSIKPLHNNVHSINNRSTNISNLVCYMDNERQMCTMSYLICSCQDLLLHNLPLSYNVQIYDGLFCYVDINNLNIDNTPTTIVSSNANDSNQNVLIDCYLLLAESNGYSL